MSLQIACQPKLKRPAGLRLILPSRTETMRGGGAHGARGPEPGAKANRMELRLMDGMIGGDCGDSLFGAESLKQA